MNAEVDHAQLRLSPGQMLAQERERQQLAVTDVAAKLRIGVRQVEALEADAHDKLPGPTFVRGFMRNYARLLRLDPEPLLAASGIGAEQIAHAPIGGAGNQNIRYTGQGTPFARRARIGRKVWIGAGFLLFVALMVAAALRWNGPVRTSAVVGQPGFDASAQNNSEYVSTDETEKDSDGDTVISIPLTPLPAQAAAASEGVPPNAVGAAGGTIKLSFADDSWVEMHDRHGKMIYTKLNRAGTQDEIKAEAPVSLVIGNAGSVKMSFNDRAIDLAPHTRMSVARLTLNP